MQHEEEVKRIAYKLWEASGRPEGRAIEHWLRAEDIWKAQNQKATAPAERQEAVHAARQQARAHR